MIEDMKQIVLKVVEKCPDKQIRNLNISKHLVTFDLIDGGTEDFCALSNDVTEGVWKAFSVKLKTLDFLSQIAKNLNVYEAYKFSSFCASEGFKLLLKKHFRTQKFTICGKFSLKTEDNFLVAFTMVEGAFYLSYAPSRFNVEGFMKDLKELQPNTPHAKKPDAITFLAFTKSRAFKEKIKTTFQSESFNILRPASCQGIRITDGPCKNTKAFFVYDKVTNSYFIRDAFTRYPRLEVGRALRIRGTNQKTTGHEFKNGEMCPIFEKPEPPKFVKTPVVEQENDGKTYKVDFWSTPIL